MARIIAAMASSHAYTFIEPEFWDKRRRQTQLNYRARYGIEPPEQPQIFEETLEDNQNRYRRISESLAYLRSQLSILQPDSLIVIGDDQDENYREDKLPQFAIYIGARLLARNPASGHRTQFHCDAELAQFILEQMVESGFDLASSKHFPDEELISHAHCEPLLFLNVADRVPIVPIFINAIHVPSPTPSRCYQFGKILAEIISSFPAGRRVILYASGGLSHFTAGYPWSHYKGPYKLGAISREFDKQVVERVREGHGRELANFSSKDLLNNGEIELRQWIALLGAVGNRKPQVFVYEPFYRAVMGMAVGLWEMEEAR